MKKKFVASKNFVQTHRVAIAVTVTSACWIALMARNAKELNAFLNEHNLSDKFYAIEEV